MSFRDFSETLSTNLNLCGTIFHEFFFVRNETFFEAHERKTNKCVLKDASYMPFYTTGRKLVRINVRGRGELFIHIDVLRVWRYSCVACKRRAADATQRCLRKNRRKGQRDPGRRLGGVPSSISVAGIRIEDRKANLVLRCIGNEYLRRCE